MGALIKSVSGSFKPIKLPAHRRAGYFRGGGERRGLSPGRVGNHVRFLEARLDALLLNRMTRQQSLPGLGRACNE